MRKPISSGTRTATADRDDREGARLLVGVARVGRRRGRVGDRGRGGLVERGDDGRLLLVHLLDQRLHLGGDLGGRRLLLLGRDHEQSGGDRRPAPRPPAAAQPSRRPGSRPAGRGTAGSRRRTPRTPPAPPRRSAGRPPLAMSAVSVSAAAAALSWADSRASRGRASMLARAVWVCSSHQSTWSSRSASTGTVPSRVDGVGLRAQRGHPVDAEGADATVVRPARRTVPTSACAGSGSATGAGRDPARPARPGTPPRRSGRAGTPACGPSACSLLPGKGLFPRAIGSPGARLARGSDRIRSGRRQSAARKAATPSSSLVPVTSVATASRSGCACSMATARPPAVAHPLERGDVVGHVAEDDDVLRSDAVPRGDLRQAGRLGHPGRGDLGERVGRGVGDRRAVADDVLDQGDERVPRQRPRAGPAAWPPAPAPSRRASPRRRPGASTSHRGR